MRFLTVPAKAPKPPFPRPTKHSAKMRPLAVLTVCLAVSSVVAVSVVTATTP